MTQLFVDFCNNLEKNLEDIEDMASDILCGIAYINDYNVYLKDDEDYKAYDNLLIKWENNKKDNKL